MSLARIFTRASLGIEAPEVIVAAHISNGLPAFSIVGLPETAVKESRERVRSALINSQFDFPARRITINLAPADLPKEGGRYDLAIAIAILAASGQIDTGNLHQYELLGELSLNGELRVIQGILPAVIQSAKSKRRLLIPKMNETEALFPEEGEIYAAEHLLQIAAHIGGRELMPQSRLQARAADVPSKREDISDVKGQSLAKRAMEIAAAGGHNLLMLGCPGVGKTLLASRFATLLPELENEDAMSVAAIHSVASTFRPIEDWKKPPFRAPHHTASAVALVGGGSNPKPGEISLAHSGVLFLDELPEFDRKVLEVLREPLEAGRISISRAARQVIFPARFQLLTAMNPCPCGLRGHPQKHCRCTDEQVKRYRSRISGPLLDRIDLHICIQPNTSDLLSPQLERGETSDDIRVRVTASRQLQMQRQGCLNAGLSVKKLEEICNLETDCQELMQRAIDQLALSGRAYHRILKVARTIGDLKKMEKLTRAELMEAINYRQLDREFE